MTRNKIKRHVLDFRLSFPSPLYTAYRPLTRASRLARAGTLDVSETYKGVGEAEVTTTSVATAPTPNSSRSRDQKRTNPRGSLGNGGAISPKGLPALRDGYNGNAVTTNDVFSEPTLLAEATLRVRFQSYILGRPGSSITVES